jgi:4'-phosphopantetheinyl transferase
VNTVLVTPDVWCRWSTEAEALGLATGGSVTVHLPDDAPAWRRREHHAGRLLLDALLRDVVPGAPRGAIELGPNGKPVLRDAPEVGVTISHSYPMVAAAVGVGWDVGVDTEVADRLWAWTVREACVKATGAGLSGRPWRIPVADGDAGVWRDVSWRSLRQAAPVPLSVAWRARPSEAAPPPRTEGRSLP